MVRSPQSRWMDANGHARDNIRIVAAFMGSPCIQLQHPLAVAAQSISTSGHGFSEICGAHDESNRGHRLPEEESLVVEKHDPSHRRPKLDDQSSSMLPSHPFLRGSAD